MRRYVTFIILGLGVFAVAAGLALRLYAYPQLAKIPHNVNEVSVGHGEGITALVYVPDGDTAMPEIRENLSLTSTTKVTGNLRAEEVTEDGDVTVWVEASEVVDDDDGLTVNGSLRSLCLDRYSGEAVMPCENQFYEDVAGERIVGERGTLQQPGLNFKFPFATEQRDYRWFDTSVKKALPIKYSGEEEIRGLPTYKFVQTVPPTLLEERDVPGSLVGQPDVPTVRAGLYYEATRTLWVEPTTGAVISGREDGKQELRADGESTAVFDGELALTDETVAANVEAAEENISSLWLMTVLPVILWIVGGVLIVASIVLLVMGGRGRHSSSAPASTKVTEPV
ncbi:MAG: DUF3068 domain-containing protein [Actinophytocola sp.]|uniref:DUF3068 domain-containing protein n=1 Tax=Actinophytocola sp. TaxID=1872138 RepID=UPI003C78253E